MGRTTIVNGSCLTARLDKLAGKAEEEEAKIRGLTELGLKKRLISVVWLLSDSHIYSYIYIYIYSYFFWYVKKHLLSFDLWVTSCQGEDAKVGRKAHKGLWLGWSKPKTAIRISISILWVFLCFFLKCVNVLKIPWWQSSFILVLNGLGWLSLSNFFLQYSIQLISPKLMWWHMENDDILNILYYDVILPVMFEGCCDLFETWCMTFMLKAF